MVEEDDIFKDKRPLRDKVIHALYLKYGKDKRVLDAICKSEFKFVKEVIKAGELKNIRLKYLGIFRVSRARKYIYDKTKGLKDEHTKDDGIGIL